MHDAHSAFKCREEDRPETIMAEFCKADFGRWETMDVSTLLSKISVRQPLTNNIYVNRVRTIFLSEIVVSVAKLRFRRAGRRSLQGRKVSAVFKAAEGIPKRTTRRPRFELVSSGNGECCSQWVRSRRSRDKSVMEFKLPSPQKYITEGKCSYTEVN